MTDLIAALPMYDWPEIRSDVDAQWAAIRARLLSARIDAPERLTRRNADMPAVPGGIRDGEQVIAPDPAALPPDAFDLPTLWRHPALLFCQTCWGPMETTGLAGLVTVVGQPDYSAFEGGEGERYSSAVVMRGDGIAATPRSVTPPSVLPDISPTRGEISRSPPLPRVISPRVGEMSGRTEGGNVGRTLSGNAAPTSASLPLPLLRNTRLAYNEPHSMSGLLALTRDLEALGESLSIFSDRIETGGHRLSIRAVAEGRADIATIDCRSWALAQRFEPAASALRVVGWTAMRKGLPFITGKPELAARIAAALSNR